MKNSVFLEVDVCLQDLAKVPSCFHLREWPFITQNVKQVLAHFRSLHHIDVMIFGREKFITLDDITVLGLTQQINLGWNSVSVNL